MDMHETPSGGLAPLPVLAPGATDDAVLELKRLLRAWYARQGERAPRRMRGRHYGANAVAAVRGIQTASGLPANGRVDEATWDALRLAGGEEARGAVA